MASPIAIPLSGFLLWMTGQSWIYFLLGVIIFGFLFAILKNKTKTENNLQEPPVLVLEKAKCKEYEIYIIFVCDIPSLRPLPKFLLGTKLNH